MKTYLLLLAMAVNAWAGATNEVPSAPAQKQMFMAAVAHNQQGRFAEAEAQLKQLAVWQPNDPSIKELLAEVQAKQKAKETDPVNVLKRRLAETIIPEVNFRQAAAQDVIQYVQATSGKLTADGTEINFVWLVPPDAKVNPVTLSMKKVPLADVLTYVTQLSGLKHRVEPHAVVIYKPEAPNAKTE